MSKKTITMEFPQALKNMSVFYTRRAKKGRRIIHFSQNKEWVFKGKYFLEHYAKPRFLIRKKARIWWNVLPRIKKKKDLWAKNTKSNLRVKRRLIKFKALIFKKTVAKLKKNSYNTKRTPLKDKILRFPLKCVPLTNSFLKARQKIKIPKNSPIVPHYLHKTTRKTISLENQKRLKKNGTQVSRRMLGKMNLIFKLQKLSLTKIKREIRLPANLPKFRFWNVASNFYYRKPIQFATNTAQGFRFKRFAFKKLMKKIFRKNSRAEQKLWRRFQGKAGWKKRYQHHAYRGFQWKAKKKKRYRHPEYRGFQHTEEFNRYLIKIGTRIDYKKLFEKDLQRKKLVNKSLLYRKRWHSKKKKKK